MHRSLILTGVVALLALNLIDPATAAEPAGPKSRKVALITQENSDSARALLDLAQVELSRDKRVVLLERQAIERVLAEQKLTLSGLVDAATAAKVGQLLGVELFAIIETGGPKKDAYGIIVYDTGSGVRYVDRAIPDGELSERVKVVVEAALSAVEKEMKGSKELKTLSVRAVRNAELPVDRETTCRSLAAILERQILGSANVAMLERKRLEFLNKERKLPARVDAEALLTSVLTMDLEFGKARTGGGLRVTAILSDGAGKVLHRATVEGKERNGSDIVDPLLKALHEYLKVAPASKPMNRVQESARFSREAEIAWSHKDRVPGIEAIEAAHALDPANAETRARLAVYLNDYAYVQLNPKTYTIYGGRRPQLRAAPEKVKASLALNIRALGLFDEALQQTEPSAKVLALVNNRYHLVLWVPYFNNLAYLDERDIDDEARVLCDEFESVCKRVVQSQCRLWKAIVAKDPSQFRNFAFQIGRFRRFLDHGNDRGAALFLPFQMHYLELSRLPGVKFDLPNLIYQLNDVMPKIENPSFVMSPRTHQLEKVRPKLENLPALVEVYERMSKHPHPVFRVYGLEGAMHCEAAVKNFGVPESAAAFERFKSAVRQTIEEVEKTYPEGEREWIQASCYRLWYSSRYSGYLNWGPGHQQLQAGFEVCDFMLAHNHVVREVLVPHVQSDFPRDAYVRQKFDLIERALKVLEHSERRDNGWAETVRMELTDRKNKILGAYPELRALVPKQPAPWTSVTPLFQVKDFPKLVSIRKVSIADGIVYACVLGQEKEPKKQEKNFVQLVRLRLPDGKPELLGKAEVALRDPANAFDPVLSDMTITPNKVYVATTARGMLSFDREGKGEGQSVTAKLELPSNWIQSCAAANGKIYAGLEGYFVEIDPEARTFKTLASSRRKETQSPFDDGEIFRIPYLFADVERDRILFLIHQRPDVAFYWPGTRFERPPTNGLWEYNYKTGKFTKHFDLFNDSLNKGTLQNDGRLLLSCHRSAIAFDLKTNHSELLWSGYPPGPTFPRDSARSRQWYVAPGIPRLLVDGWLWSFGRFGRFSLETGKLEYFPHPLDRPGPSTVFFADFVLSDAPGRLIVGDHEGVWLFKLRPESPIKPIEPIKDATWALPREVQSLAVSANGRRAVAGDRAGNLRVRDLGAGRTEFSIDGKDVAVTSVAFACDGRLFAAGFADGSMAIFDVEKRTKVAQLPNQLVGVNRLLFAPDGRQIATGYADGTIIIWDAVTAKESVRCKGHVQAVPALAFTADGKLLSGSMDRSIRVWDVHTGKLEREFPEKNTAIVQLALVGAGKSLLTLGDDSIIREWDVATGKQTRHIPTNGDSVVDFSVSPEEKRIATASREQRLRIWDLGSGVELRQTRAHTGALSCLSFCADGTQVLTGGEDRQVMMWKLPAELLKLPRKSPGSRP
jgi:WD40 repeat protein